MIFKLKHFIKICIAYIKVNLYACSVGLFRHESPITLYHKDGKKIAVIGTCGGRGFDVNLKKIFYIDKDLRKRIAHFENQGGTWRI